MSLITCKQCGADNASDSKVCQQCKTILNAESHVICSSCYHRNPLHLLNCVNCGTKLNKAQDIDLTDSIADNNDDMDIFSILDIQLDSEEMILDQPRRLSIDQLTPTDWISELDLQDDALPTMSDMLPQSEPLEPINEAESADNQNNVMDMLFGDNEMVDPGPDNLNLKAPEADINEFEMDGWLTDVMSGLDDDIVEKVEDKPADWLDIVGSDNLLPFESNIDDVVASQPLFEAEIDNEINLKDENRVFEESEINEDSLDWLINDTDVVSEPESAEGSLGAAGARLQTRDLSEVELPTDVSEDRDDVDAGGAIQAELPNWIKEMAPNATEEAVVIPDEDNFQMNDAALLDIIATVELEPDSIEKQSDRPTSVFEPDDSQDISQSPERSQGKFTQRLSRFDMTAPEFDEPSYFGPDSDENEIDFLKDFLDEDEPPSDIESESGEIDELDPTSNFTSIEGEEFPEWLSQEDENQQSESSVTATDDLPEWLQKLQTGELEDPRQLGFTEANVEDIQLISADDLPTGPADELDEIILKHMAEDLSPLNDSILDAELSSDQNDEISQFDWADVESEPQTETDLVADSHLLGQLNSVDGDFESGWLNEEVEDDLFAFDEDQEPEEQLDIEGKPDSTFDSLEGFYDDQINVATSTPNTPDKVGESISTESLAGYISNPEWEVEPDLDRNRNLDLDGGDDFLSTFSDSGEELELPSWANELTSTTNSDSGTKESRGVSTRNPLYGIKEVVEIASILTEPIRNIENMYAPQVMEPVAHRRQAYLAAKTAGVGPVSNPTEPVGVPKARQRYQPRFTPAQLDGGVEQNNKKRSRRIGFLLFSIAVVITVTIAFGTPYLTMLFPR
jgi:ribosomal protein L40E